MNKLKGIIYDSILWFATFGARRYLPGNKLLVVRVDEIGDYMLWHKFLEEIVTSERYKEYEIHFCGNQSWRSLFDEFDSKWVNRSFWIDKIRFKKDMRYRFDFLKQVASERYDVVINPTFSRDKRNDDSIVRAAKAPENIGMKANMESAHDYESGYDKNLYTKLFDYPERPIFEFYRNRLFTEFVTGNISDVINTKINTTLLPVIPHEMPEKYFVVFPGSRSKKRIWPAENFVLVANYLFENYGWTAVLAGTRSDKEYTDAFLALYKQPVADLTGKTSLLEMMSVLKSAQCLLSVDTGSVHLAAAVGCTVCGIFNGSQYKRFAPYPPEMISGFHAIYPDDVEIELREERLVRDKYEFVVDVPYQNVKAEKVIQAIYRAGR
jgi:ADP-heptose:LPS heptosyltransferase